MMYTSRLRTIFLFLAFAWLAHAPLALAADTACIGTDQLSQLFCSTSLPDFLNKLFQISISLGAILAMLRIAYAGYLYMGSADMWGNKAHAKEVFKDAVIGLLILLSIWLILYQINPQILRLDLLNSQSNLNTSGTLYDQYQP